MPKTPCTMCSGTGYTENVALYYGRAECTRCGGTGNEPVELTPQQAAVIDAWAREICTNAPTLDPGDELDWRSLFIGFALGRGLSIEDATDYTFYMDYAFPLE